MKMKAIAAFAVAALFCFAGIALFADTDESDATTSYNITTTLTNVTDGTTPVLNGTTTDATSDLTGTFAAATGYDLPASIVVKIGSTTLVNTTGSTDKYSWNSSTGALTVKKEVITNDVTIIITGVAEKYTLTKTLTNCAIDTSVTPTYGQDCKFFLSTSAAFSLPSTITVAVGGTAKTVDTDYTYDTMTGLVTIKAATVTGNITITAAGVQKTVTITTTDVTNGTPTFTSPTNYGNSITGTIVAGTGYKLPATIEVKVGNSTDGYRTLVLGTDYTYTVSNGTATVEIKASVVTNDVTIKAVCEKITYKVIQNIQNGSIVVADDAVPTYGEDFTAKIVPNVGYNLPASIAIRQYSITSTPLTAGVSTYTYSTTGADAGTIVIKSGSVLYDLYINAICAAITYDVTFDTQSGSVATIDAWNDVAYNTTKVLPSPGTKANSVFVGWFTAASAGTYIGMNGDSFVPVSDNALFARWVSDESKLFTVSFNSNGGSSINAQKVVKDTTIGTPLTPTKIGYTFDGWYTTSNLSAAWTVATGTVANDLTLYAKWVEDDTVAKHTVTFNTNGGSSIAAVSVIDGNTVALPATPTKTGYTFEGWYRSISFTTSYNFGAPVTADITLYAKWTPVSNGGDDGKADNTTKDNGLNWFAIVFIALGAIVAVLALTRGSVVVTGVGIVVAIVGMVFYIQDITSFQALLDAIKALFKF